MIRAASFATLIALGATAAACASATSDSDAGSGAPAVVVEVENGSRFDVDVSALIGPQEIRLGRAQLGDTGRFRIAPALLPASPYAFAIKLVARTGGATYTTPILTVREGQSVHLDTGPSLGNTRFTIR